MSDLERLDEALAFWDKGAEIHGGYPSDMTPIIDAARAYRDLANGERVDWCVQHKSVVPPKRPGGNPGMRECESVSLRRLRDDRSTFIMCSIGGRLLVDPPTEED